MRRTWLRKPNKIGYKFIEFAKQFGVKQGKKEISVGSYYVYDAKDFYLKAGFKRTGSKVLLGRRYHTFVMRLTDIRA